MDNSPIDVHANKEYTKNMKKKKDNPISNYFRELAKKSWIIRKKKIEEEAKK